MRHDLLDWAEAYFQGELGLLPRKTFSCPSWYRGKKMFAFLYGDALGIKTTPQLVLQKIEQDPAVYSHFNPGDGIMKNWLMITYPEAAEYDAEREFMEEQLRSFLAG